MRLWFTNIYAVVVAAILFFLGGVSNEESTSVSSGPAFLLVLFGLILSVLGLLVVLAVSLGYENYLSDVVMVFYVWDKMEFHSHASKPIHFRSMHRYFYEITIALFLVLTMIFSPPVWHPLEVFQQKVHWQIVGFIVIVLVIELLYHCTLGKQFRVRWRFAEALQKDTNGRYRKEWQKWFKEWFRGAREGQDLRKLLIEDAVTEGIIEKEKSWPFRMWSKGRRLYQNISNTLWGGYECENS